MASQGDKVLSDDDLSIKTPEAFIAKFVSVKRRDKQRKQQGSSLDAQNRNSLHINNDLEHSGPSSTIRGRIGIWKSCFTQRITSLGARESSHQQSLPT